MSDIDHARLSSIARQSIPIPANERSLSIAPFEAVVAIRSNCFHGGYTMRFEFAGDEACVFLIGELTFADHATFRDILTRLIDTKQQKIVIDLSQLEFVDSAGLGMLLIARDEVGKAARQLSLSRPQKQVDRMFAVTKFDSLFTIVR